MAAAKFYFGILFAYVFFYANIGISIAYVPISAAQYAHKKQHAPTIRANSAFPSQLLFSHIQPCIT